MKNSLNIFLISLITFLFFGLIANAGDTFKFSSADISSIKNSYSSIGTVSVSSSYKDNATCVLL